MLFDYSKGEKLAASFPRSNPQTLASYRNKNIRGLMSVRRKVGVLGIVSVMSVFLWAPILKPYNYYLKYPEIEKSTFLPDFVNGDMIEVKRTIRNAP